MQGMALKSDAKTRVVSIEPLGAAMRCTTSRPAPATSSPMGWVSHNCFARPTHTYLDFNAGRDFEKEIVVKVNVPEVLRAELRGRRGRASTSRWGPTPTRTSGSRGATGSCAGSGRRCATRRNPCSVLTKSPLLLRDLDLMQEIAAVTDISANLSVPTIDEKAWRASEPHTPNPRARLEAVGELNRAGIPTGILVAPLMPGINDDPAQVEEILQAAADAGATASAASALHLRGEVRGIFMEWLRSYRPDLVERYEELYARGAYCRASSATGSARCCRRARTAARRRRPADAVRREPGRDARRRGRRIERDRLRPPRPPEAEQTTLF